MSWKDIAIRVIIIQKFLFQMMSKKQPLIPILLRISDIAMSYLWIGLSSVALVDF